MVVDTRSNSRMTEAALSVSLSPLLPSLVGDETPPGVSATHEGKRVRFQPVFQPTHTVFTPRLSETSSLRYRKPDDRVPNYDDFLRRVSVVLYSTSDAARSGIESSNAATAPARQHRRDLHRYCRCRVGTQDARGKKSERVQISYSNRGNGNVQPPDQEETSAAYEMDDAAERDEGNTTNPSSISSPRLVDLPVEETFREEHFVTPQYKYTFVRLPRVHPLTYTGWRRLLPSGMSPVWTRSSGSARTCSTRRS
ncbi:hypothetical protein GQ600_26568 [Phytophthora cactorum]|nr:hypothetical protein GQ600_26568 [Phytophthora cactorum]